MNMQDTAEIEVDIEDIMQEIRQKILAAHTQLSPNGEPLVNLEGKHLPPLFYEHLYQAGLSYNGVGVKMFVSKSNIPLVGSFVEKIRGKIHELVLYYVNQIAEQQIEVNYHLLQAVNILGQEFEAHQEAEIEK